MCLCMCTLMCMYGGFGATLLCGGLSSVQLRAGDCVYSHCKLNKATTDLEAQIYVWQDEYVIVIECRLFGVIMAGHGVTMGASSEGFITYLVPLGERIHQNI